MGIERRGGCILKPYGVERNRLRFWFLGSSLSIIRFCIGLLDRLFSIEGNLDQYSMMRTNGFFLKEEDWPFEITLY
ncbi:hypothetical protein M5K25_017405 [Dendrobium thyrsiflorum]|uniref:Uncharacterized protein n=1 Tax=Dendrobium thyrsiflorum TaxID=117978 RepID=A0ABD0UMV9_DENTH